jgi:hypothetical protein
MDTKLIKELNDKFGIIDWRLPSAHSLYWAYKGMKTAQGRSRFLCSHMLLRSLTSLFSDGTLEYDSSSGNYKTSPYLMIYEAALREHLVLNSQNSTDQAMKPATVSFLSKAVYIFHSSGSADKAGAAFEQLKKTDSSINGTLDEFIRSLSTAQPQGTTK